MDDGDIKVTLDELKLMQQQVIIILEHIYGKMQPTDEWLDSNDLCRLFKVTEKTIYRWRKSGQLIPFTKGRKCFYSKNAFNDLIKGNR